MVVQLLDPEKAADPQYEEVADSPLPKILKKMDVEERERFRHLVEKKAWIRASEIAEFTDEEQSKIAEAEKKGGPALAKKVRDRLYLRHHWESLRWFLFGGLVDIPIQQDITRAWDPTDNPFIKIRAPGFVWTKDEHDHSRPHKRLPDKEYMRLVSYAWVHEPLLAIPKSRQMMVTWLFCSIACHETLCRVAKRTAWISKKFDDANAHIKERIKFIADELPKETLEAPDVRYKSGFLECEWTDSLIQAMGEEAKGLRQYTFSWVFDDETVYQDQAEDIVEAALPTIKGGGRFTLVSSPSGKEVFHRVVSEQGRIPVPPGK